MWWSFRWTVVCVVCWGCSRLLQAQESTTDQNDCYRQPCQNGGTCVDMFQSYRCECPRNFNGTNCEHDLAREFGCAVDPCENNGTCVTLSGVSPGALPYRCDCREGFVGVNCETLLNQCEITPNPCHLGVCTSNVNSFTCNCTGTGFRGRNCSEDIDECEDDSSCGTGRCFNIPGTFSCQCPSGFDGPLCQDIDECASFPCKNNATCSQGVNNYTCACPRGFDGINCENNIDDCANVTCPGSFTQCVDGVLSYRCICLEGYENKTGVCVEIDECQSSPCLNNGSCLNRINAYHCDCLPGYDGDNCQVNIDECANGPCQNNGSCQDGVNSFTCACLTGYTGDTCGTNIDDCVDHQCRNGASCVDLVNGYRCDCVEGWAGDRCSDNIDDCANNPCRNEARCNDLVANYTCTCLPGYEGYHCETNIDDCSPDPCENGASCKDGVNDYTCQCASAWMGRNCSEPFDACSFQPCQNNATCSTTVPQRQYTCTCVPGFNGTNCENNIDDCVGNTCQDFEHCFDGIGTYTCACPIGFEGERCRDEIDECQSNPCQNEGTCNDYVGFYNCTCPQRFINKYRYDTGYKGLNCDEDIDECAYDPPICQNGGTCTNRNGSYECRCLGETPTGELITGLNCQVITSYCRASGGNPCQNGATCRNIFGTYACDCLPGYTDKNCSTDINECLSSPCQYNGSCIDRVNGYNCSCIPGITGPNCETNIDDCADNPCGVGTCHDKINDYECNCTDTGFRGRNCEVNIDDCVPGICQHNGSCRDGVKNYTCECLEAYTGANCETDVLECASSPCQYNGTCLEFSDQSLYGQGRPEFSRFSYATAAGYLCDCIDGIEGVNCEININDCVAGACQNNATCVDGINAFSCRCAPGYEGKFCQTEINECDRYTPCRNGATCKDLVADYSCACQEFSPSRQNYGGKNCSVRLSGCDQGDNCQNGQCIPILVSEAPLRHDYLCRCEQGFRGRYCDVPTTVTFSSNGSLIRFSPSSSQQDRDDMLSFWFRTTLTHTVLVVYAFAHNKIVSVEIDDGMLLVMYRDDVSQFPLGVESQERVNNAKWHHAFLHLQNNVSLTLVSDACGREQCVVQFAYPRGKPQVSSPNLYFGKMTPSFLSQTLSQRMYVGCLEDIIFDGTYLFPGQPEGEYFNLTQRCPRSVQCEAYTCNRHGSCTDLWDRFRCECDRPFWGTLCEKEYTKATFYRDGVPSMAMFRLDSLASTFASGLDLSLFLRTRQKSSIIMYLTNEGTTASTSTILTMELQNGCLATRINLCGNESYFSEDKGIVDLGSLNFVRMTLQDNMLQMKINDSLCINETVLQGSCPFRASVAYFGKVPEIHASRHRRQAMATPPLVVQLPPFNGILTDVWMQNHTLDFEPRAGAEYFVALSTESNVTFGAVSTVNVCNTSQPCENGGTCSDVFFNDFECECPDGYLGKNCSQPDFCKPTSCPSGSRCQSLQLGFECISVASFDGVNSVATYRHTLPNGLPSQRITFFMRTRSFHGAIIEVRASQGHNFIKIRVRDGSLEVNYLLKASGFSSSMRMLEPVNDGEWYYVEMEIDANNAMSLRLSRNDTIIEEEGPEPLEDTVTDLTSLVTSGSIQVGDVADRKEQAFEGCLEELRVGGVLLPFILDDSMNLNTAVQKFSATALSRIHPDCDGADVCRRSLCVNGGQCQDDWNDYSCQCRPGYEGELCEREVNECEAGGCRNGALCLDGVGTYSCVCPPAYTGTRCETPFNACANHSCANGSNCSVDPAVARGYVCQCADASYSGDLCDVNIENKSCADNLCQNSVTCTDDQNGSSFTCTCAPGYTGSLCESPINYCVDLPCNNGTCSSDAAQQNYTCQCNTGFSGDVCQTNDDDCIGNPCQHGGTCVDGINHYSCDCVSGWEGQNCTENINECDQNVCQHGVCDDRSPGYFCDCANTGYTGPNCSLEFDECAHNFCLRETSSICTNLEGSYECTCLLGFVGKNCTEATCDEGQCKNGSTCQIVGASWGTDWECVCQEYFGGKKCDIPGPCVLDPCNATNTNSCRQDDGVFDSSDPINANYTCSCKEGWKGDVCSEDIDECGQNICQHGASCENLPGSFECNCTKGYNGTRCEIDIDECATDPCQNQGICTQGIGTFTCNCSGTGYEGDVCLDDINECERFVPCQNNNTCTNSPGSFTCECGAQYLGDRCEHLNPCSLTVCQNGGSCNHTWNQEQDSYLAQCSCIDGYHGSRCEKSPQTEDDDLNLLIIIGPVVAAILLIIIIGVIVFIMVARKKRATHGAYSPSRQETAGARVELGNVLKKPPEERLI